MKAFWNIANGAVLLLLGVICGLGSFYKHISFGLGLGDLFGYAFMYLVFLIHLILTVVLRKKGRNVHAFLALVFLSLTAAIALNATLWRGREYPWNGELFYLPCPTEIPIQNPAFETRERITMCTGHYNSEVSGVWDGHFLLVDSGVVQVPAELQHYIHAPVNKIGIAPAFYETIEDGSLIPVFRFDPDTLQVGEHYRMTGQVCRIQDHTPILRVRIR